ncbi:MAG: P-II family nitrogen regulator, partial [Caldilineaceae bacterium]|nr:P-II family nitrogen regulator [Caldilineaceae bacterium]
MTKKIEAFIREEKFEDVKQALYDIGIVGMNVIEVHGHGRQGGITMAWRTGTYKVDLLPRYQLNIVLSDHNVEKAVETIRKAAHTGQVGDGVI